MVGLGGLGLGPSSSDVEGRLAEAYATEQKEIAQEMQELRAAQHWVNQEAWDAAGDGFVTSAQSETIGPVVAEDGRPAAGATTETIDSAVSEDGLE